MQIPPSPGGAATHGPPCVGLQSPVRSCPRPGTEQIPTCPQLSPARCQEQKRFLMGLTRTSLVAGDCARLLQGSGRSILSSAPAGGQQGRDRFSIAAFSPACSQSGSSLPTALLPGAAPRAQAQLQQAGGMQGRAAWWPPGAGQQQQSSESQGCCCTEQSRSGSTREVLCLEDRSLATKTTQRSVFYKYAGAPGHAAVAARSRGSAAGRRAPAGAVPTLLLPAPPGSPTTSRARARSQPSTAEPWHGAGPKGTGPCLGWARLRRSAPGLSPATCKPRACPSPCPPLGAPLVGDAALLSPPSAPPHT